MLPYHISSFSSASEFAADFLCVRGGCFEDGNSDVQTAWDSPSVSGRTVDN